MGDKNWNLDGEVIAPVDYEVKKMTQDECHSEIIPVLLVVLIFGIIIGFVSGYVFAV